MDTLLKVEGHDGLVRDMSNHAIVNNNTREYETYMAQRREAQRKFRDMERQQEAIDTLRSDVDEIKMMLKELMMRL